MATDLEDWLVDGGSYAFATDLRDAVNSFEERLPVDGSLDDEAYREGYLPVAESFENAADLFRRAGAHAEDGDMKSARNYHEDAYNLIEEALQVNVSQHAFPSGLRSRLDDEVERIRRTFTDIPRP